MTDRYPTVDPAELEPERRVMQTRLHIPPDSYGDCTECCAAALLGVPRSEIADFPVDDAGSFWLAFEAEFNRRGFDVVRFDREMAFEGLYMAGGPTSRGTRHSVVMRDGQLVHDPHPSGDGLASVERVWIFVPYDPAQLALRDREIAKLKDELARVNEAAERTIQTLWETEQYNRELLDDRT